MISCSLEILPLQDMCIVKWTLIKAEESKVNSLFSAGTKLEAWFMYHIVLQVRHSVMNKANEFSRAYILGEEDRKKTQLNIQSNQIILWCVCVVKKVKQKHVIVDRD